MNIMDVAQALANGLAIQLTKNYEQFKFLKLNRNIDQSYVQELKRKIENRGLLVPILIDKNGYVMDGQHRLMACKELEIPVQFIVNNVEYDKDYDWKDIAAWHS